MSAPTKRLIVEIKGGCLHRIIADGIDLSDVQAIHLDHDTEGCEEEQIATINGERAFFEPFAIGQASDEYSRDVRRAYDTWVVS